MYKSFFLFFKRANTLKTSDDTYFKSCRYDLVSNPYCPVFTIKNIITKTKNRFEELSLLGGVVRIDIEWKCNLDQAKVCTPQYSFGLQDKNNNFRTATYYWDKERREHRDLLKLYGIRFEISVTGEVGFQRAHISLHWFSICCWMTFYLLCPGKKI
ncbi:unnamed protein product [Staurois parvus]|uniref:Purinergic receptor n=1 Tax=Staurois parvus TaxID=386267 RepID=A0ABN9EMG9_9NEOB|nr:unnamed protein product [Staurois parvus]